MLSASANRVRLLEWKFADTQVRELAARHTTGEMIAAMSAPIITIPAAEPPDLRLLLPPPDQDRHHSERM